MLHIPSLPGKYGIGTLGEQAHRFAEFLGKNGQKYWQLLPLVPLGEGNSPYKSTSCFAGEILYIDSELLVRDGLLYENELPGRVPSGKVDYSEVRKAMLPLLELAVSRFKKDDRRYRAFLKASKGWLEDYALFEVLRSEYGETLDRFPEELRFRQPAALEAFSLTHRRQLEFHYITQYLFYSQYSQLRETASRHGVRIIGDIPFYVALDSADVWTSPDCFRLGRDMTPVRVAGVPPDIFSDTGQLWGNPVYDWDYQRKTAYAWWKKRLKFCSEIYDVLRIDHFRAFSSYYSVPFGAADARAGVWEPGPGLSFWRSVEAECRGMGIIAEDLGGEEPDVEQLVLQTGFPNMKVLQFGFSTDTQNRFYPKNYRKNCVCYTGTHDNETALGWYQNASIREQVFFSRTAPCEGENPALRMIALAMRSKAGLVIIPMQDWLCLDNSARMNTPGTLGGNWEWQMADDTDFSALGKLMRRYGR